MPLASGNGGSTDEVIQGDDAADPNIYRLFDKQGEAEVVAVPFVTGTHVPQNMEQLIQVAEHMKSLHSHGYVHGDIRLLNMVFGADGESQLIDFDFGGREGHARYPLHYKPALTDGQRSYAVPGELVRKEHDVKGLVNAFIPLVDGVSWGNVKTKLSVTIDELIGVLKKGGRLAVDPYLETFLTRSKGRTADGDPVSPAKAR